MYSSTRPGQWSCILRRFTDLLSTIYAVLQGLPNPWCYKTNCARICDKQTRRWQCVAVPTPIQTNQTTPKSAELGGPPRCWCIKFYHATLPIAVRVDHDNTPRTQSTKWACNGLDRCARVNLICFVSRELNGFRETDPSASQPRHHGTCCHNI